MTRTLVVIGLTCCAAVPVSLQPRDTPASAAPGAIRGHVHDKRGDVLPGVTISVSRDGMQRTVVTDAAGSYQIDDLDAGSYTVTAVLAGFARMVRPGVVVRDGEIAQLDLALCPAALEFIDWIVPPDLAALWTKADVVARVETATTQPVRGDCPDRDVEHRATIRELFKNRDRRDLGPALTFVQENWNAERTPYPLGQDMIVFLGFTPQGFRRVAGPTSVFLVRGDRVTNDYYLRPAGTIATADFLSKLRTLGRNGAPDVRASTPRRAISRAGRTASPAR